MEWELDDDYAADSVGSFGFQLARAYRDKNKWDLWLPNMCDEWDIAHGDLEFVLEAAERFKAELDSVIEMVTQEIVMKDIQ